LGLCFEMAFLSIQTGLLSGIMQTVLSLLFYNNPYTVRIQQGAAAEARRLGLAMLHDSNFDWDLVDRVGEVADGLLLGRNRMVPDWTGELPWVGVLLPQMEGQGVFPDSRRAAEMAVTHFQEQKLTHLACYRNLDPAEPEHRELEAAFVASAAKALLFRNGAHVKDKWTMPGHLQDLEDWLRTLPKPVGILCGDEDHASRLLKAIDRVGLGIPEQVAVLVYGIDMRHPSALGLSGIDPDFEAVGAEAVRALAARLRGEAVPPLPRWVPPKGLHMDVSSDRRFSRHPLVRRVIQDLERNGFARRNVAEIACELGISKSSLNLAFREATGNSIADELKRRRLEQGVHLLETTDRRITNIAFDLGYEQPAHFSRDIKKHTGKTPKQLRNGCDLVS